MDYCFRDFEGGSWHETCAAKFVPWLLSQEQKEFRAEVAQDLLETTNNDPDLLKKVITRDESWVYGYDPETKAQSSQWKSPEYPHLKKVRQSRSNVKAMLTVFFIMKVLSTTSMLLQA
jgi:type I site-specific restriction endonuclease